MPFDVESTLGQLSSRAPGTLLEDFAPLVLERFERAALSTGPGPELLDSRQLRFALCGSLGAANQDGEPDRLGFLERVPAEADTPLRAFVDRLLQPFCPVEPTCRAGEFAWSVACEMRESRRCPEERDASERPSRAFRALFDRCHEAVVLRCRGIVRRPSGATDAETMALEAFARAFETYWCATSRIRFLGLCRIRTLLLIIARREWKRVHRREAQGRGLDDAREPASPPPAWSVDRQQRWTARLATCVEALPPKARIVWSLHHERRLEPWRIAEHLRLGRPAVVEHLQKARARLAECLRPFLEDDGEVIFS